MPLAGNIGIGPAVPATFLNALAALRKHAIPDVELQGMSVDEALPEDLPPAARAAEPAATQEGDPNINMQEIDRLIAGVPAHLYGQLAARLVQPGVQEEHLRRESHGAQVRHHSLPPATRPRLGTRSPRREAADL